MNYHEVRTSLGEVVRDLRSERGYSQEAFAHSVGLHRTYISDIERGERNVSLRNLVRIADTLEIPLSRLIAMVENHHEESAKS
jgi:transcriptional regulator with XRE-family HTH domain